MKKLILLPALLLAIALGACTASVSDSGSESSAGGQELTAISVYPQSVELAAGDSASTEVVVTPSGAGTQNILWVSSNEKVATVDNKGNITAVGKGICTITAASTEYSNIYCDVSVSVSAAAEAAPAATPAPSSASQDTYVAVMPKTDASSVYPSYYLSEAEAAGMDPAQIQFVINQIYAKNGYIFAKDNLQNYFSQMSWYTPISHDTSALRMSSMDNANLNLLIKYRDKTGNSVSGIGTIWTYYFVQQNLTASMISQYSSYDIQLMINTIYAMNGYIFNDKGLQALFSAQPWYSGRVSDMAKVSFSSRDKANLNLLISHR